MGARDVEALRMYAVLFVVVGVTFAVGLSILSQMSGGLHYTATVENETANISSQPENYTVSKASNSAFVNLTSVTCYDTTAQNSEVTCSVVDKDDGVVEFDDAAAADSGDTESLDYDYKKMDEQAQKGVTSAIDAILTFTQWLGLIALIIVAGIIIRHVTGFGRSAGGSRGRA